MPTTTLDQELRLLARAAEDSQRELERLITRLSADQSVRTVRDLHDVKSQLTYLRLLLRTVTKAAATTPTPAAS